ncbi:MAG: thiamine phosphate synthase [candidate division WOR-3 bacterium]
MRKLPLLYGIFGSKDDNLLYKIERSILGGVRIFQLRIKGAPKEEIIKIGKNVKKLCDFYGVTFIVNDDPEIALLLQADGVHIGKDDADIAYVRKKIGNKILGVSCYDSIERAKEAENIGADYVSMSSPFPSPTKKDKKIVPFDTIKKAKDVLKIPLYVIGGINKDNISILLNRVKCGICAISGIYEGEDPFINAFEMREKILLYNEGSLTF